MQALTGCVAIRSSPAAFKQWLRCFALNSPGPVAKPEIGNSKKGEELTDEANLQTREITEQELYHAAVPGDLRSSSGNGLGDGLFSHTSKWLQVRFIADRHIARIYVMKLLSDTALFRLTLVVLRLLGRSIA